MLDRMGVVMRMWRREGESVAVDHGLQGLLGYWFEARSNEMGEIVINLHLDPMRQYGVIGRDGI